MDIVYKYRFIRVEYSYGVRIQEFMYTNTTGFHYIYTCQMGREDHYLRRLIGVKIVGPTKKLQLVQRGIHVATSERKYQRRCGTPLACGWALCR